MKIKTIPEGLTFDDVLLVPSYSDIKFGDPISTRALLCRGSGRSKDIYINAPFISATMDTVTMKEMAIALARLGSGGSIQRKLTIEEQVIEVEHVKRHQSNMVTNPYTLNKNQTVKDALKLYQQHGFGTFPVVENGKLLGLITGSRINNYSDEPKKKVSKIMVPFDKLSIVYTGASFEEAKRLMKKYDIEKIPVVKSKSDATLIGLYFKKDIENISRYPNMSMDSKGRLLAIAGIGVGDDGFNRAVELVKAGVDVLCIDVAHGDHIDVIEILKKLKKRFPNVPIIAGNVVTSKGALRLIKAGANALKVGIGPGAICTTRKVTGNGVPQITAIQEVYLVAKKYGIPIISDGGIKETGDVPKAFIAGADTVMMGSVFAGTDEAPGEIFVDEDGQRYKKYRGMGSKTAMDEGKGISTDRYFKDKATKDKVPEGIDGKVPYKGPVEKIFYEYLGALKQSMAYQGARNLDQLRKNGKFVRQTNFGLIESGTRVQKLNKFS